MEVHKLGEGILVDIKPFTQRGLYLIMVLKPRRFDWSEGRIHLTGLLKWADNEPASNSEVGVFSESSHKHSHRFEDSRYSK